MFYDHHFLCNSDNEHSFFHKKAISLTSFMKRIKSSGDVYGYSAYFKIGRFIPKSFSITVNPVGGNEERKQIQLRCNYVDREHEQDPPRSICVASVTIATVNYNCGAVHISNLYAGDFPKCGLGWWLYNLVEKFLLKAGYTFVFGNTAGVQNSLVPVFEKHGWEQMNIEYINERSRNTNIWMYKMIGSQKDLVADDSE